MSAPVAPPELVPMVLGGPELLFGVDRIEKLSSGSLRATQEAGLELVDDTGTPQLAGLGVLVDDVLGCAVNQERPGWSVSTELSIDLIGAIPTSGLIACEGRVVHADAAGALATGEVLDARGAVLARCVLRGRFGDFQPPEEALAAGRPIAAPQVDRRSIDAVFGESVAPSVDGLRVRVDELFLNPLGNLHGGMHLCLVERAGALAAPELDRTASVRLQLVRRVPGGAVLDVRTTTAHRGRTLAVVEVAVTDETGRTCALGTVVRH